MNEVKQSKEWIFLSITVLDFYTYLYLYMLKISRLLSYKGEERREERGEVTDRSQ